MVPMPIAFGSHLLVSKAIDVAFPGSEAGGIQAFRQQIMERGSLCPNAVGRLLSRGIEPEKLSLADRWILHQYNHMLQTVSNAFNDFDFHIAANELYTFTWDYFCDWYLEIAKIQIAQEGQAISKNSQTKRVLHTVFEGLMRAMHPIMPFITEDLWGRTPKSELFQQLESIMFAPYPRADQRFFNEKADERDGFLDARYPLD